MEVELRNGGRGVALVSYTALKTVLALSSDEPLAVISGSIEHDIKRIAE